MIRVIAFDLDDTLWHVDPVIRNAEKTLAQWIQTRIEGFEYDMRNMSEFRQAVIDEEPHLVGRMTDFRRSVISRALAHHGVAPSSLDGILDEAMEVFLAARNDITFFEGALDVISKLSENFTLGALSNGNADISRLGLGDLFSFAFSAEDVGAPKPAPDLFHTALDHAGCKPHEMVYVGDDPIKDVDAANAVGLQTIWLKNERRPGPGDSIPDGVIEDIRELPATILEISLR